MKHFCYKFYLIFFIFFCSFNLYSYSNFSTGGAIDINMGSNQEVSGTGSFNFEYYPLSFCSIGAKISGESDFSTYFATTPAIFARLYPFSNAFAEGSIGGKFFWKEDLTISNLTAGASVGWRIISGRSYIEPKINLEYLIGAEEPFVWSAGVGAGYNF